MRALALRLAEHPYFGHAVTVAILVAGVVVGIETSPTLVARWHGPLHAIDQLVLWIFTAEALVKLTARRLDYFKDPWNLFDFSILTIAFLPLDTHYVAVLRLARLLRFLRLVRALPKLQILVGALLKSIPSMGYVGLLLALLFYVYAVAGVFLFGTNDPLHFGSLPIAFITLFRVVTGDGWTDLMYLQMYGCDVMGFGDHPTDCTAPQAQPALAAAYFVSFVLVGAMVILNLFIGVIMNGMEEAKLETEELDRQRRGETPADLASELDALQAQLTALQEQVHKVRQAVR